MKPAVYILLKYSKKIARFIVYTFAGFIFLFVLLWASFHLEFVQTQAVNFCSQSLSATLRSKVTVERVNIGFFNKIILRNIVVQSLSNDTIATISNLEASLKTISFKKRKATFYQVVLNSTQFHLSIDSTGKVNISDWYTFQDTLKDTSTFKWKYTVNNVKVRNSSFSFREIPVPNPDNRFFNGYNILVSNVNSDIQNINISNKVIAAQITNLSCKERSGFSIKSFQAQVFFTLKSININNISLTTPFSSVYGYFMHLKFDSYPSFIDFNSKVKIDCKIEESSISTKDIAYFFPQLLGLNKSLAVNGLWRGYINDFAITDASISTLNDTKFNGNIEISGLPDIEKTYFFVEANKLTTSTQDIVSVPLYPFTLGKTIPLSESIKKVGRISYTGNFTGFIHDIVAFGKLSTSMGNISSDILLNTDTINNNYKVSGTFKTEHLKIGELTELYEKIGAIDMDAKVNGSFSDNGIISTNLDGTISSLVLNNYNYKNISINGNLTPKKFDGRLSINDPNIEMLFTGICDFDKKIPSFNFSTQVGHLNLHHLNVVKGDSLAALSFSANAKFDGNKLENLKGKIAFDTILFENSKGQTYLSKFDVDILDEGNQKRLIVSSDIIDGELIGSLDIIDLQKSLTNTLSQYLPSVFTKDDTYQNRNNEKLQFNFVVKDISGLSHLLLPDLSLEEGVSFSGNYDFLKNYITLNTSIPYITYKKNIISNFNFNLNTDHEKLNFSTLFDAPIFNVDFKDIMLEGDLHNDSLQMSCKWFKQDSILYKGIIHALGIFRRSYIDNSSQVEFTFAPTGITVADSLWNFGCSKIFAGNKSISVNNITFINKDQILRIDGKLSENPKDSMSINLTQFDLKYFRKFMKNIDVSGRINGYASLFNDSKNFIFHSQLITTQFGVSKHNFGDLYALSEWDALNQRININIFTKTNNEKSINLSGYYFPEDDFMDFTLRLDNTNLNLFDFAMTGIFSNMQGILNGQTRIWGKAANPLFDGYIDFTKSGFMIDYLRCQFSFAGRLNIKNHLLHFADINAFDSEGNSAKVKGEISLDDLSNPNYNIIVDSKKLLVLDTKLNDNEYFYGKAYGAGVAKISGDTKQTLIDVAASTSPGTKINIPINEETSVNSNTFITFKTKKPKNIPVYKKVESSFNGVQMNFDLDVTPDAEIQLILNEKLGDIIKSQGSGAITLNIDTKGLFRMYGTYEITTGDYLFTMGNLLNKKFFIEPGSKLTWNGNVFDATADLTAHYNVKTALSPLMILVGDSNKIYNRRIPLACKIKLTDKILSPTITFSVDMSQADEKAKEVYSNLSEDNKNQQFISLLALNSFFFTSDQFSNISSITTSSEVVSNQLSNLLSKINKDVNFGINYQPSTLTNKEEIDVAVSTEVLQNRVLVSVNGYTEKSNATGSPSTDNTLMGDVNIEVKLNKKGNIRAKGFSRTNTNDINETKAYTQGIGLFYTQSFNTLGDLLRKKRKNIAENTDNSKQ